MKINFEESVSKDLEFKGKEMQKNKDFVNVGRNNLCPCESGKKYKKCCLNSGKYERYEEK